MKHILGIMMVMMAVVSVAAQEVRTDSALSARQSECAEISQRHVRIEDPLFPTRHHAPYYDDQWEAHEGVNVRVSASATVGLGSGSPSGVGLGRSLDILYVSPIKNKLGYTLGATTSGMDWGGFRFNEAGVHGSLSYFPNENLTLTLNGYKSILSHGNNTMPYPYPYYGAPYYDMPPFLGGGGYAPYLAGMGMYGPCDFFGRRYYGYPVGHIDSYVSGDINWKLGRNSWLEVHIGTGSWK